MGATDRKTNLRHSTPKSEPIKHQLGAKKAKLFDYLEFDTPAATFPAPAPNRPQPH